MLNLDFVSSTQRLAPSDLLDTATMTRRIEDLAMDDELKYYLYENYLDKLGFAKNSEKNSNFEQIVNTSDRLIMQLPHGGGEGGGGGGGGGSSSSADPNNLGHYYSYYSTAEEKSKKVVEHLFYESENEGNLEYILLDEFATNWPDTISKYEHLSKSHIPNTPNVSGFLDYLYTSNTSESKMSINVYRLLTVLGGEGMQKTKLKGTNMGQVNVPKSINKRWQFKSLKTGEIQSIYLNYQVSIGDDSKSSFGVLTASVDNPQKQMILNKKETNRLFSNSSTLNFVPSVFGVPIDFYDMNLSKANRPELHIDNSFMLSTIRPPVDNATKLNGVVDSYYDISEALEDFKDIEYEVAKYIFSKLNGYKIEHIPNSLAEEEVDKNYLHFASSANRYSYLIDNENQRVLKSGVTSEKPEKELHLFLPDKAGIHGSNDNIFASSYKLFLDYLKSVAEEDNGKKISAQIQTGFSLADVINYLASKEYIVILGFSKSFGEKMGLFTSVASYIYNFVEAFKNLEIDETNLDKTLDSLSKVFIKIALPTASLSLVSLGLSGGGLIVGIIATILDVVPTANGHSVFANINDAGLNDGDFQMKNNFENMLGTARNWSEGYHKGVTGKIVDDMFKGPDLYIKAQGDPDSSYKLLSPGDEFNGGHKMPIMQKQ